MFRTSPGVENKEVVDNLLNHDISNALLRYQSKEDLEMGKQSIK